MDGEIIASGFTLYRKDRGGGVLLAMHDSIPSLQLPCPDFIEMLAVLIYVPRQLFCALCTFSPRYQAMLFMPLLTI